VQVRIGLLCREASPPNHSDEKVDSDQLVVNKEVSLSHRGARVRVGLGLGALRRNRLRARQERARLKCSGFGV